MGLLYITSQVNLVIWAYSVPHMTITDSTRKKSGSVSFYLSSHPISPPTSFFFPRI
jgi:hypothetical protein